MFVHVFVHSRAEVKVARVGQAEKTVSCERCRCNYCYTVYRRGVGQASESIFRSKTKAAEQATHKAIARVNKLLENAIEPVPCPACGWVQSTMTREMRRSFARWMIWAGWISLVLLVGAAGIILAVTATDGRPITFESQRFTLDTVALAISLWIGFIGGRRALTSFMEANGMYAAQLAAIPGVPMGYRTGKIGLVDKNAGGPWAVEPTGRITVQLAVAEFPAYCCCCMKGTRLSQKMRCGGLAYVMLPFCRPCAARVKRTSTTVCGACAFIGAVVACGIPVYLSSRDAKMIAFLACFGAMAGISIGYPVSRFFRPIFVSRFRRERNTVRIYFKNHRYAALMREEGRLV